MNKNQIEEIDFNTLSSTQERYIDIEPYIEKGLNKFDEGIEEKMRKRLQEKNPITKMSVRNNQEGQNIYIASSENGFSTAGGNEETRSIHKANNPFKNRPN